MSWSSIRVETNKKPEVWLWMCHLSYVLNEDTWIAYKFWWSSMIRVGDLIYHEEGWVMLLQYFGYVIVNSLLFKGAISSTMMWYLRFANSLSQHNWVFCDMMPLDFYLEWHDFIFWRFVLLFCGHVSTEMYYMQRRCCVVVSFPSASLKNMRSWVYLLYCAVASIHGTA
jgi:hypothetical protein